MKDIDFNSLISRKMPKKEQKVPTTASILKLV